SMTKAQGTELLRQIMGVRTRGRALVHTTVTEDRRFLGPVTCATGAFLAVDLLGRIGHIGLAEGRVRASLRTRTLPANDAVQDVGARLKAEQRFVELNRTGNAAVEFDHVKFHASPPSTASTAGAAAERIAAGRG